MFRFAFGMDYPPKDHPSRHILTGIIIIMDNQHHSQHLVHHRFPTTTSITMIGEIPFWVEAFADGPKIRSLPWYKILPICLGVFSFLFFPCGVPKDPHHRHHRNRSRNRYYTISNNEMAWGVSRKYGHHEMPWKRRKMSRSRSILILNK